MSLRNVFNWGAAIGAGLFTTVALLPQAHGELVYDETNAPAAAPTTAQTGASEVNDARVEDRRQLRQALGASERAQTTVQADQRAQRVARPYPAQVTQVVPPPQAVAPAPQAVALNDAAPTVLEPEAAPAAAPAGGEVENFSKTDLMRRERVREEIKNEDVLQERLEELRLRDERRRTQQLLGASGDQAVLAPVVAATAPAPAAAPVQEAAVVAPSTVRPGQPGLADAQAAPAAVNPAIQQANARVAAAPTEDEVATSRSVETSVDSESPSDEDSSKTKFSFGPYVGMGNVNVNDAFDVKPHYAVGAGIGIGASDNITVELGYTYGEYGVTMAPTSYSAFLYQSLQAAQGSNNLETLAMHQNVFNAGMKFSLLGQDSKIRPFVGGGGAYAKNFINYNSSYNQFRQQTWQGGPVEDYTSSQFLGYLATGLEVQVSKTVSLVGTFKYYGVLSTNESNNLNYLGFVPNPYLYANADQRAAGASLSESSFYQITGGATFVF